jgi:hypothetical protein
MNHGITSGGLSRSKLNMVTSSHRVKPDSHQTHQHKTDRLTLDSRPPPNAVSVRPHHNLVCISLSRSRHCQNFNYVRFQALTAASMKVRAFWDATPAVSRRFTGS